MLLLGVQQVWLEKSMTNYPFFGSSVSVAFGSFLAANRWILRELHVNKTLEWHSMLLFFFKLTRSLIMAYYNSTKKNWVVFHPICLEQITNNTGFGHSSHRSWSCHWHGDTVASFGCELDVASASISTRRKIGAGEQKIMMKTCDAKKVGSMTPGIWCICAMVKVVAILKVNSSHL